MINGVNISTNEKELDIKYGLIDFGPERENARVSVKYILTDMNDIRKSYIRLGFHLSEFERMEYYKDFGYASLQEFCDANIGLDKSAVSRCIGVFRSFNASLDSRYVNGTITKGSAMELGTCWQKFSYSQLCEMLSLDDKMRELVKPEMTIKQIRELKKKKNVSQDVSRVATSQPENALDIKKYENCYGAARQSIVKKAEPIDSIVLEVYDQDGKPVSGVNNIWVDLLAKNNKYIVVRLTYSIDAKE
ncbi:MAG: hypothetical protein IJX99_05360 [Clostridia bacterium]|nr:hypothetical protein [Clostridia bacterium]